MRRAIVQLPEVDVVARAVARALVPPDQLKVAHALGGVLRPPEGDEGVAGAWRRQLPRLCG